MAEKPPQDSSQSQIERFKQLARELDCDDDEARFAERVKRLATAPKPAKAAQKKG